MWSEIRKCTIPVRSIKVSPSTGDIGSGPVRAAVAGPSSGPARGGWVGRSRIRIRQPAGRPRADQATAQGHSAQGGLIRPQPACQPRSGNFRGAGRSGHPTCGAASCFDRRAALTGAHLPANLSYHGRSVPHVRHRRTATLHRPVDQFGRTAGPAQGRLRVLVRRPNNQGRAAPRCVGRPTCGGEGHSGRAPGSQPDPLRPARRPMGPEHRSRTAGRPSRLLGRPTNPLTGRIPSRRPVPSASRPG